MDIKTFVNITSRAWTVPILAKLHEGVAARQAPLVAATGAGRTAFAQSMDHLIDLGLIERNPGYGHPLRPEFRLTAVGCVAAEIAHRIYSATSDDDHNLIRRSWTLPILVSIGQPIQFNVIKRKLPSITDRALSSSLRLMEDRAWVARDVDVEARPPKPLYRATNTGAVISAIAAPEVTFG